MRSHHRWPWSGVCPAPELPAAGEVIVLQPPLLAALLLPAMLSTLPVPLSFVLWLRHRGAFPDFRVWLPIWGLGLVLVALGLTDRLTFDAVGLERRYLGLRRAIRWQDISSCIEERSRYSYGLVVRDRRGRRVLDVPYHFLPQEAARRLAAVLFTYP